MGPKRITPCNPTRQSQSYLPINTQVGTSGRSSSRKKTEFRVQERSARPKLVAPGLHMINVLPSSLSHSRARPVKAYARRVRTQWTPLSRRVLYVVEWNMQEVEFSTMCLDGEPSYERETPRICQFKFETKMCVSLDLTRGPRGSSAESWFAGG
jgi:hypothetical protein